MRGFSVQGLLIRWTGLQPPESHKTRLSMNEAEATIMQAQLQAVQRMAYDANGELLHPMLLEQYTKKAVAYCNYAGQEEVLKSRVHAHFDLVLSAIAASRVELLRLHSAGDIDEHILVALQQKLDLEELNALAVRS